MGSIRPSWPMRSLWLAGLVFVLLACGSAPTATPTVPPGGQPSVIIESPANGSPAQVGRPLVVQARADDSGSGVNRIDLRVGGILVDSESTPGLVAQPSFSAALQYAPSADGAVSISVTAYRPDGTASPPAEITIAVLLAGASLPPSPPPTAGPTVTPTTAAVTPPPTPGITPTAAPRPTLPPFATPSPTARPTAPPTVTPTPLLADLETYMDPAEIPSPMTVDQEYLLSVYVRNYGPEAVPATTVRLRLCNPSGGCGSGDVDVPINVEPLDPDDVVHYTVGVTPQIAGERQLRVRVNLPSGYADPNTDNNVNNYPVTVNAPESPAP